MLLASLLWIFTCIFALLSAYEYYINRRIAQQGINCIGTVVKKSTLPNRATSLYFVTFHYQLIGSEHWKNGWYSFRQFVSITTFKAIKVNEQVPVRYLAKNPNKARLWGAKRDNAYLIYVLGVTSIFAVLAIWGK